jgi:hypothetical protein
LQPKDIIKKKEIAKEPKLKINKKDSDYVQSAFMGA